MTQICNEETAAQLLGVESAVANKTESPGNEEPQKPEVSYIEMIGRAILESPTKRLCLQDIYESIERTYPYFRTAHPGWRNSVRHNLSLHECFYKGERCENGKGHYWYVHPMNLDDFRRGDFRRRMVKARVRRMQSLCHPYAPELYCSYAPLQYYVATTSSSSAASTPTLPFSYAAYYPTVTNNPLSTASTASAFPFQAVTANIPLCVPTQPLFNTPAAQATAAAAQVGGYQQVVNTAGSRLTGLEPSQPVVTSTVPKTSPPGFLFSVKNILSTQ